MSNLISEFLGEINPSDFYDRIRMQKLFYVFKYLDLLTKDYYYTWHLRGPYSTSVAKDYFDDFNSREVDIGLKNSDKLEFLKELDDDFFKSSDKMEIVASILFICQDEGIDLNDTDKITYRMDIKKPDFTKEQVLEVLSIAKKIDELKQQN